MQRQLHYGQHTWLPHASEANVYVIVYSFVHYLSIKKCLDTVITISFLLEQNANWMHCWKSLRRPQRQDFLTILQYLSKTTNFIVLVYCHSEACSTFQNTKTEHVHVTSFLLLTPQERMETENTNCWYMKIKSFHFLSLTNNKLFRNVGSLLYFIFYMGNRVMYYKVQ